MSQAVDKENASEQRPSCPLCIRQKIDDYVAGGEDPPSLDEWVIFARWFLGEEVCDDSRFYAYSYEWFVEYRDWDILLK